MRVTGPLNGGSRVIEIARRVDSQERKENTDGKYCSFEVVPRISEILTFRLVRFVSYYV